ncbi:hypothetical protein PHYSODRAFT_511481, partial [Phytophthora sojae]
VNVYCNARCCPYGGKCGNGLEESSKIFLGRNFRTQQLEVVAAEDISAGEVLGHYLGEIEHVSVSRANRPRNNGYRLLTKQRPEKPTYPICAAINAEGMGGLMRFLNHSCEPAAEFREVSNGRWSRRRRGASTVARRYDDDLWFVCRCERDGCRHRNIQDGEDP